MSSQVDPSLAKRLAEHYAPECRFDSREEYFPCSIDWMATNSSLRCKTWWTEKPNVKEGEVEAVQQKDKTWATDVEVTPAGQIDVNDPKAACESHCQNGEGATKHQHRLVVVEEKWDGQPKEMEAGEVPCYYAVVPAPCDIFDDDLDRCINNTCQDVYEITYYMVYAYNGNVFAPFNLCKPIKVGTHVGDIEQVVIYVKDPNKLKEGESGLLSAFMNRHAGEGRFTEDPDMTEDNHPIVYPATESHASYSKPSWTCRIFGFANDLHNGKGKRWQTWKNLVAIDKAKGEPKWIEYDGRFGGVEGLATRSNLGRPGFGSNACRLPAMLPDRKFNASALSAQKQIPKRLMEAVGAHSHDHGDDQGEDHGDHDDPKKPE